MKRKIKRQLPVNGYMTKMIEITMKAAYPDSLILLVV